MLPVASMELSSFDGRVRLSQRVGRPDRYRHLEMVEPGARRITRGGGYSYAAAGFGGRNSLVQDGRHFNRILAFDSAQGLLECEAGTTLGKIHAVASASGWYLPVQPGYPHITVGGCVAADVHGKNQFQDGNFHHLVKGLHLFHPRHGDLQVGPDQNPEVFELTCGGFGLTGHIVSARLQLSALPGRTVGVRKIRIPRFEDTLALLEEHAPRATFIYTWHDFTERGDAFGRGFLYSGEFLRGSGESSARTEPRVVDIDAESRGRWGRSLLNAWTTRPFNAAYRLWQGLLPDEQRMDLFSFLFPVARKVVYFRLFGAAGFRECQFLIPRAAFGRLAAALRSFLTDNATPVALASCKLFRGTQSHLRFDGDGVCLAVDFPSGPRGERFTVFLDGLVRELGGRPNIIKDSRLSRDLVEACFPEYARFRDALRRFDPERLYVSELSERLGL